MENIEKACSFVLVDEENKTAVLIQDNPAGGFILVDKGQGEDAARIVKKSRKADEACR